MIKNVRVWLGFVVSVGFIGLFIATVDVSKMGHALANARYQYVAVAVALYFSAVFFRTLRWQYLLEPMGRFKVGRLFPVVTVGYMANNILPARLGEVVRAYYLARREGIPTSAGVATIIIERVYDGLTLLLLAAVAAPVIIWAGLVDGSKTSVQISWGIFGLAALFIFLLAIGVLTLLAINPSFVRLFEKCANLLPGRIPSKINELLGLFVSGLSVLKEPQRHLGLFVRSLPVWLLEGAMYLVIGLSFDLQEFFDPGLLLIPVVLLVTAVSNLATSIPSSPGSIGTFEFPAVAALTLVGVGAGVAGAFALMLHVYLLVPVTILGLIFLWCGHDSLTTLTRRHDRLQTSSAIASDTITMEEAK